MAQLRAETGHEPCLGGELRELLMNEGQMKKDDQINQDDHVMSGDFM